MDRAFELGAQLDSHPGSVTLLCDSDLVCVASTPIDEKVILRLHAEFYVRWWLYTDRCPNDLKAAIQGLQLSEKFVDAFRSKALPLRYPDANSESDYSTVLTTPELNPDERAIWENFRSRVIWFLKCDGIFPLVTLDLDEAAIVPFRFRGDSNSRGKVSDDQGNVIDEWTTVLMDLSDSGLVDVGVEIGGEVTKSFLAQSKDRKLGGSLGLALLLARARRGSKDMGWYWPLDVIATGAFRSGSLKLVDNIPAKRRAAMRTGVALAIWPGSVQGADESKSQLALAGDLSPSQCIAEVAARIKALKLDRWSFHRACACLDQVKERKPEHSRDPNELEEICNVLTNCRSVFVDAIENEITAPAAERLLQCKETLSAASSRLRWLRHRLSLYVAAVALVLLAIAWLWQEQRKAEVARLAKIDQLTVQGRDELSGGSPMRALPYLSSAYEQGGTGTVLRVLLAQAVRALDSQISHFGGPSEPISNPTFSRDGSRILGQTSQRGLKVCDANTGQKIFTLTNVIEHALPPLFAWDGTRIVTARGKTAVVWDAADGKLLKKLEGHSLDVKSIQLSPDGGRVVTASVDDTAKVWDAESGALLLSLTGHMATVRSATFSFDGSRIATTSVDETAKIWNATNGVNLATVPLSPEPLDQGTMSAVSVRLSPDGRRLLVVAPLKFARLFDVSTSKLLAHFDARLISGTFDRDGKRVFAFTASQQENHTINVVDLESQKILSTLEGHTGWINTVELSPSGSTFLSTSWDKTAKIWDVATGKELMTLEGHEGIVLSSASYNRDGTRLVTGDGNSFARVWDVTGGKLITSFEAHSAPVNSVAYSTDGNRIITSSHDRTVKVWDAKTLQQTAVFGQFDCPVTSAFFSHDGTRIVTTSSAGPYPILHDPNARIWDVRTGKLLLSLGGHTNALTGAAFGINDSQVITIGWDRVAKVWNSTNATLLASCSPEGVGRFVGIFTRDPRTVIVVTEQTNGVVRLCDAWSGAQVASLVGHTLWTESCAFSSDGKRIVTGNGDKTAKLWDVSTGKLLRSFEGHTLFVNAVAFSPDDSRIVTASEDNARIWDALTGTLITSFEGAVRCIAFSPDGSRLLTADADGMIRVWDVHLEHRPPTEITRLMRERGTWQLVKESLLPVERVR